MEARPVEEGVGGVVGPVTLTPNEGSRSQKWGVGYNGATTAYLGPGLNGNNLVSVHMGKNGSFADRLFGRRYNFQNCYGNEKFRIINVDTDECLAISGERFFFIL